MTRAVRRGEPDGIVMDTDLYYPGQHDPIGLEGGGNPQRLCVDRIRYVVWVTSKWRTASGGGWAPRIALHVNHWRQA